jgi:hypothetical protein
LASRQAILEGRPDVAPRPAIPLSEHKAFGLRARQAGQRIVDGPVHRHLAPPAALRVLELEDAAGEVHALPGQARGLPFPHAGVEGDRNNGQQIRALSSLRLTGRQKARDLLFGQEA